MVDSQYVYSFEILGLDFQCNGVSEEDPKKLFLCLSVYQRVEKTSVYELVVQLHKAAWIQGMEVEDNLARRNMTDQMLHLVNKISLHYDSQIGNRSLITDWNKV